VWAEIESTLLLQAGGVEYAELQEALARQTPACHGLDVFTRKASASTADETRMMEGICASCPVLSLCRAYASAGQPELGFWGGAWAASWKSGHGAQAA